MGLTWNLITKITALLSCSQGKFKSLREIGSIEQNLPHHKIHQYHQIKIGYLSHLKLDLTQPYHSVATFSKPPLPNDEPSP